jgi:hypothetical protein
MLLSPNKKRMVGHGSEKTKFNESNCIKPCTICLLRNLLVDILGEFLTCIQTLYALLFFSNPFLHKSLGDPRVPWIFWRLLQNESKDPNKW